MRDGSSPFRGTKIGDMKRGRKEMPNLQGLVCSCEGCKQDFDVGAENLIEKEIEVSGEILYIKLLQCPLCNAEYVVQIDNPLTKDLLKQQMVVNAAIAKKRVLGKKTKRQERRLKEISYLLLQHRENLNHKFDGSVYIDQNENKTIKINEPAVHFKAGNN